MWSLKVLIALCTVIQWEANGVHGWWYPSDCYNLRFQNAPSGMYYIQPLGPNTQPIRVYCEMTIGGGGFAFFFPAALQEHHQRAGLSELYFETGTMSFLS